MRATSAATVSAFSRPCATSRRIAPASSRARSASSRAAAAASLAAAACSRAPDGLLGGLVEPGAGDLELAGEAGDGGAHLVGAAAGVRGVLLGGARQAGDLLEALA